MIINDVDYDLKFKILEWQLESMIAKQCAEYLQVLYYERYIRYAIDFSHISILPRDKSYGK